MFCLKISITLFTAAAYYDDAEDNSRVAGQGRATFGLSLGGQMPQQK